MRLLFAIIACLSWSVQAGAAELVMVERDGCHWCDLWNKEIAHIYPKTEEGRMAPLRRVDIHALPNDVIFASHPVFTPTFVLVDDGKELGRLEGYAGADFFWHLLSGLINAHPDSKVPGL